MVACVIFPSSQRMGIMLYKSRMYENAISHLKQAFNRRPNSRRTMVYLAKAYCGFGDKSEEITIYERLVALYPRNIQYNRYLIQIYEWDGDIYNTLRLHTRLYNMKPFDKKILLKQRTLLLMEFRYKEAVRVLERYFNRYPNDEKIAEEIKNLHSSLGNLKRHISFLLKLANIRKNDLTIRWKLADLHFSAGILSKAKKIVFSIIKHKNTSLHDFKKAILRFSWNNLFDEEVIVLKMAIKRFPNEISLALDLAQLYLREGHTTEAIKAYQDYLVCNPVDDSIRLLLSKLYSWNEQPEQEIEQFETLLKTNSQDKNLWQTLGQRYEWSDLPVDAINAYENSFKISADLKTAQKIADLCEGLENIEKIIEYRKYIFSKQATYDEMMRLFNLYKSNNQQKEAFRLLDNFMKNSAIDNIILEKVARIYEENGKYKRALYYYKKLSTTDPRNSKWVFRIAQILDGSNNFKSALPYYKLYVKDHPDEYQIMKRIGEHLLWDSEYKEALKYLIKYYNKNKHDISALLFIAECDYKLGKRKSAQRQFKKVNKFLKSKAQKTKEFQEYYVLSSIRLGHIQQILPFLHKLPENSPPWLHYYLGDIIDKLFNEREYTIVLDYLNHYLSQNNPLDTNIINRIQYEAEFLKSNGKWDLAQHLLSYVELKKN